ncbi:hypothetical protein DSL72_006318 [Monilinia vaccinii-corymbosi]|uniref:Anaphase-promoting complex subunit 4 WD40 domain-containing protein n=1 Tax=Monilinia vaccinii-corymbosi TaxID=61207 RepID=A0A8A3PNE0_9HELO|nr:hypothetical protein DSL72_006318 [Monilinia vaccinii-corymbosi]
MEIHRCRFIPYPPSTINALAFTHSHLTKGQSAISPRLAVGRANGDIELWNPQKGSWLQETIIRGGKDRSIDGLVWTQDPDEDINGTKIIGKSRLFSIGYTTTVTEWDLVKGQPLRSASGNHGEIWCLAAQPAKEQKRGEEPSGECQKLVAGCVDGALVLYSTADEDLQLQKVLVRPSAKKAKVVSITFQDHYRVVAGFSDSNIRVYDIRTGSMLRQMSLGVGPKGGPKDIIVWAVKALPNGHIISGDSTGEIKIWHGKTYSMMQHIKSHTQDVLSLATSFDGMTIFSGGMDRRTVIYKQNKAKKRWTEVGHRRYHTHDVKAMATLEGQGISVVVSGGPDAAPILLPLAQFGQENQRALPFLPQPSIIQSSTRKRLMMSWWDREIHIWYINKFSDSTNGDDPEAAAVNRKLVAKILVKGESNITSATLNPAGNLLAVSTVAEIKLFRLKARKPEEGEGLKVSTVSVPPAFSSGARLIQFSPDGNWLSIIRDDSSIAVARIIQDQASPSSFSIIPQLSKLSRLDRDVSKTKLLGGLGAYERNVTQVAFSSDSRILVVSDLAGFVDTWVLEGIEDLTQQPEEVQEDDDASDDGSDDASDVEEKMTRLIFGQHWTQNPSATRIPKLPAAPTVLSFRPSNRPAEISGATPAATRNNPNPVSHELPVAEDRLVIVTSTNEIYEFGALAGSLSPWSRRNPTSIFPLAFRKLADSARGCIWDISNGRERLWLHGVSWLWMFDLSQDFHFQEEEMEGNGESESAGTKRKRFQPGKSGAGGIVDEDEKETGMSRKVRKLIHEEVTQETELDLEDIRGSMDVDSDDGEIDKKLKLLPRKKSQKSEDEKFGRAAQTYNTLKYRPILGVVEIGEGGEGGLEVAIVERPIWEANLPTRYEGDQEWEKKSLY